MPLARIRRLLADGGAKRLSAQQPFWELASPWWPFWRRARRFEALQVEILIAGSTLPGPAHLVTGENPQAFDVGGAWAHAHVSTYRVPPECDFAALNDRVLRSGSWCFYASHEALDPQAIPDAFSARTDQIATFAAAHQVPLLVQASPGNDRWRLWVEEVDTAQEVAA